MDELAVIGVENGALIVVSTDGDRFRVPITEALHTALRQNRPAVPAAHRVGPRDVQAMIRSGLSATEVADRTGEPLEYIRRFEGPVLAEREYVVTAARSVPVSTADESDDVALFGTVIDSRLDELGARAISWSSRKKDGHWIVAVDFLDGDTERTATWTYEPKRSVLAPTDHEAQSLSRQGSAPDTVLPRLRAVPADEAPTGRFDSGAFNPTTSSPRPVEPMDRPVGVSPSSEEPASPDVSQTADLLDALRRRRGERESAALDDWEASRAAHPSTGSIRIVDVPLDTGDESVERHESDEFADSPSAESDDATPTPKSTNRRGRAAMPSWDEIVFGARPDDDPA
ncbi:septation protein SepH [Microcella sp.]|uniref:septation protein SepH n=1 Tax=Microcella sp. TaxID=1913979 RepID=UPI0025640D10|nr:septation protein SepH [Microcella sp.]MBX9470923.1 DUF3071 domain-containing protein [Microcella sp.]